MEDLHNSVWNRTIFAALMVICILGILHTTSACTCYPLHPQRHFCDSNFVVKARVLGSQITVPDGYNSSDAALMNLPPEVINSENIAWKIRIATVYKGHAFMFNQVDVHLYTPLFDGLCGGYHLEENKIYVLMGEIDVDGKLNFDFCKWHKKWTDITPRQKKGLRHLYQENCDCHVHTCGIGSMCGDREQKYGKVCDWNPFRGACHNNQASCTKQTEGSCSWEFPKDHKDCLMHTWENPVKIALH